MSGSDRERAVACGRWRGRDAENAELRATVKSLLLRVVELERQRGSGSDDSGTPSSKLLQGGAAGRDSAVLPARHASLQEVVKLGPGGLQSWTGKIIKVLGEAHDQVGEGKADGRTTLDPEVLAGLRGRYDAAVALGIRHNRHRDWHDGNHPRYTLATWLTKHADQVWLFTTNFAVEWTSNAAERGVKPAKRHQAVGRPRPWGVGGTSATSQLVN